MNAKLNIYVVRHGKTMMNTLERVQGWCDSPLTLEGIEVARFLGYGLSDIKFRTAYCSDLKRTRQTVQIILGAGDQQDIPIIELAGLREACFGSFEADFNNSMWRSAALFLQYVSPGDMYNDLLEKKVSHSDILGAIKRLDTMGMAESYEQVEARTQESLKEIAENEITSGNGNILVVAHGMSILAMLLSLGGDRLIKGHLDNAAVCKVTYQDGKFTVESMGDMSYIEHGRKASFS